MGRLDFDEKHDTAEMKNITDSSRSLVFAGRSAITSAIAWILQLVFVGLFFSIGQPFGTLSDLANTLMVLLMLPYALAMYRRYQDVSNWWNSLALVLSVIGVFLVAGASGMLVLGSIEFEQSLRPVLAGLGLIGIWIIGLNILGRSDPILPRRMVWLGIMVGVGLVLLAALVMARGALEFDPPWAVLRNPIAIPGLVGGLIAFLGYPAWAIWLGKSLIQGDFE